MSATEWKDEWRDERQRKQEITRDAREASEVLNHPKVAGFLEAERGKAWRAFRQLPLEAPREQFQALRAYLEALDRFEGDLNQYITRYYDMLAKEQWETETGGRDPADG